jgi:hypothetical protein
MMLRKTIDNRFKAKRCRAQTELPVKAFRSRHFLLPQTQSIFTGSNVQMFILQKVLQSFVLPVFIAIAAQAQYSVNITPDSNKILIGEFLGVQLSTKFSKNAIAIFPDWKDSLGQLEIISVGKKDTATLGNEIMISQRFTVSAYDSGLYTVPPQRILFAQNGTIDTVFTEEFLVEVATVPVDTTKNFKPIKAPLEVPLHWSEYLLYVLAALAIVLLGVTAWWLFKKYYKGTQETPTHIIPYKVAHIWALKELQMLEQEKLWQKDDPKLYYTRLTDIFRKYLEYRFNLQALESTTDEIELMLQIPEIQYESKEEIINMLRLADLVKFAQLQPLPQQGKDVLLLTREFVKATAWKEDISDQKTSK